jgi:hypothetical protein
VRRLVAMLFLGCGLVLAGWAQPPSGDTQEPPVRLKKKKKTQPEQPPDKPERPETQPELKKKPKLDEDADLDPRDDLKLQGKQESEEDEILQRIARNTRLSEEKLANREVGEGTRKLQEEVVKDLDRLIEKTQQDQQNQQNDQDQQNQQGGKDSKNDGSSSDASSGQQGKPSQRSAQERTERKKRRQAGQQTAQRSQGDRQGGEQPKPMGGQGNNPTGGGGDSKVRGNPQDPDKKFDLWGHLPEKERARMNKQMEQKFMEKYDDLTKQFYRTIAEKSRRK